MELSTRYLGLALANPLVASAGPLVESVDGVRAVADGGVGAIVLHSLFEEQLRGQVNREIALLEAHSESFAEALDYFPTSPITSRSVAYTYLSNLERAAKAVDVPLIASLNGSDLGGWVEFARELTDAGAAAIELNIYMVPGDVHITDDEVVRRHLDIVRAVRAATTLPLSVKMSPYFSSPGHVAMELLDAGADGLVLFNRFLLPDVDVESLDVTSGFDLSVPHEGHLPRTWIAALRPQTTASLAGSSGVDSPDDVVKYLLSGADVVMTTASLLRHGVSYAGVLLEGLADWMVSKGFSSVDEFRGRLALPADVDASQYERSGYVAAIAKAKQRYGSLA